jgi:hypothetical protein
MNAVVDPGPVTEPTRRESVRVTIFFILISLGVAVAGIVRHQNFLWTLGVTMIGVQIGTWLTERWVLRDYGTEATALERFGIATKAYAIIIPIQIAVGIGLYILFPDWFPMACPLPPR